jgi:hypothetical protein
MRLRGHTMDTYSQKSKLRPKLLIILIYTKNESVKEMIKKFDKLK